MPLPLIPIAIGLGSAVAGALGLKQGIDAKKDFERAENTLENAKDLVAEADGLLDAARKRTDATLVVLGQSKAVIVSERFLAFKKAMDGIRNIDTKELGSLTGYDIDEMSIEIEKSSTSLAEVAGGVGAAGAGGALTALAAYGGTQLLATASTGTAISALSGAAATNATLAWFGGGSLAAGGTGMAGGMVVLGGAIAGPALFVGGFLIAMKASTAVDDANSNMQKAIAYQAAKSVATKMVRAIGNAGTAINDLIVKLGSVAGDLTIQIEHIRARENDFIKFTPHEKSVVANAFLCMKGLSELANAPILKKDGALDIAIRDTRDRSLELLNKLSAI